MESTLSFYQTAPVRHIEERILDVMVTDEKLFVAAVTRPSLELLELLVQLGIRFPRRYHQGRFFHPDVLASDELRYDLEMMIYELLYCDLLHDDDLVDAALITDSTADLHDEQKGQETDFGIQYTLLYGTDDSLLYIEGVKLYGADAIAMPLERLEYLIQFGVPVSATIADELRYSDRRDEILKLLDELKRVGAY